MDKLCWWSCNGRYYPGWRHVPALATNPSPGRVVPLPGLFGSYRAVARHLRHTTYIIRHHCPSGKSWHMDISSSVCRCRIRTPSYLSSYPFESNCCPCTQVDSFIPLWEWDLPKKKSKKKKSAEKSDKGKGASSGVNTPDQAVDDVDDSGVSAANSRSASRAATVEDVTEEIS
jgi:hypothetical protein